MLTFSHILTVALNGLTCWCTDKNYLLTHR